MEIIEKGQTITIQAGQKFPIKSLFVDVGLVLILVWGVFGVLIFFFSQPGQEFFPYFIAITLLLIVPLICGILIRQSRYYREILIDGERGMLSIKSLWRRQPVPFNNISSFQINRSRFKRGLFIYGLQAVLSSGKTIQLIQDVPDKEALRALGEKTADLVKKPLSVND